MIVRDPYDRAAILVSTVYPCRPGYDCFWRLNGYSILPKVKRSKRRHPALGAWAVIRGTWRSPSIKVDERGPLGKTMVEEI